MFLIPTPCPRNQADAPVLEEIRDAVMGLTIPEALTTELEAACKTAGFPTELTADMGKKDQPFSLKIGSQSMLRRQSLS